MRPRGILTVAALAAIVGIGELASQASAAAGHPFAASSWLTRAGGGGNMAAASLAAALNTPACTAGDLDVWVAFDQSQSAAGTRYFPVEFTNLSQRACTLYEFPGVSACPKASATGQPGTVSLAPGGTGSALLAYSDVITGDCPVPASTPLSPCGSTRPARPGPTTRCGRITPARRPARCS